MSGASQLDYNPENRGPSLRRTVGAARPGELLRWVRREHRVSSKDRQKFPCRRRSWASI